MPKPLAARSGNRHQALHYGIPIVIEARSWVGLNARRAFIVNDMFGEWRRQDCFFAVGYGLGQRAATVPAMLGYRPPPFRSPSKHGTKTEARSRFASSPTTRFADCDPGSSIVGISRAPEIVHLLIAGPFQQVDAVRSFPLSALCRRYVTAFAPCIRPFSDRRNGRMSYRTQAPKAEGRTRHLLERPAIRKMNDFPRRSVRNARRSGARIAISKSAVSRAGRIATLLPFCCMLFDRERKGGGGNQHGRKPCGTLTETVNDPNNPARRHSNISLTINATR